MYILFLRRRWTTGPLQLVISEHLTSTKDDVHMDEGLRRTVNELMRRKVLSEFSHPAKCLCEVACLIKGQCGHDDSVDS